MFCSDAFVFPFTDDDIDEVSEMKHTKTFVHEATNELMLGKRESAWNAFRCFVRVEGASLCSFLLCLLVLLGFEESRRNNVMCERLIISRKVFAS